ncbi:hypothetical protein LJC07_04215 [Christensenellaceae bacterium OttesenSCG-928-L17]|nr:hypothetical protein [Christensenellaceae bacterium OttesenSCG-928-L17]
MLSNTEIFNNGPNSVESQASLVRTAVDMKHFVCFIDILGFKHTILQSCTDNQALEKVFTVLKAIEATKKNLSPTNGMTVNFDNRKLFEFPQKVSCFLIVVLSLMK